MASNNEEKFVKLLGHGSFGKVYLCKKNNESDGKKHFAIKQIDINEKNPKEKLENECTILHEVATVCEFICKLYHCFVWNSKFHMVMKFNIGGDLNFNVKQRGPFSPDEARFIIAQLTIAIGAIHNLKYVFRDIKAENIMLDSKGNVVLVDFGLAKKQSEIKTERFEYVGTPSYMAPEIFCNEPVGNFECAIDWWAMGVTLSYVMTGTLIFVNPDDNDATIAKRVQMEEPSVVNIPNEDAQNLVLALINKNRTQRMNGAKIRKHPFFATINWEDLKNKKNSPPFKPKVKNEFDTSNFSNMLTKQRILPRRVPPVQQDLDAGHMNSLELRNAPSAVTKKQQKREMKNHDDSSESNETTGQNDITCVTELAREEVMKVSYRNPKRKPGHPRAPEEETICKKCQFKARRPSDLKNHYKAVHSRLHFKCNRCSKEYKWANSLVKHQKKKCH